ncbi:MAG TPA: 50S ribosomal protein L17 [Candidatus Omnitrophota bacterium]|nr:50S ribosomal protein L17 [Candidatus Omnitrophota bacterium]
MRHQKARTRLNRNSTLLKATMRDMAKSVLIQQRICTTKPKAKEARKLVDRLITLGKKGTLAAKRRAFAVLCDHDLVSRLFNSIAVRFNSRQGGYTRIIPLGHRRGDNAQLAYLELTEKDKVIISKKKTEAQSKPETKTKPPETHPAPTTHSKKDVVIQEKPKSSPKIFGNIKKMFTKKPPSSGS